MYGVLILAVFCGRRLDSRFVLCLNNPQQEEGDR